MQSINQFIVRPMTTEERENWYCNNGGLQIKESPNALDDDYDPIKHRETILDYYNVPKFFLDLNMYQRSCDTALGVPFNIASMSLLLIIIAKVFNMLPGEAFWIGGDTHLYVTHIDSAKEQLTREPMQLPKMKINKEIHSLEDVCNLTIDDFELVDYESHPKINFELFTGLKKK